MQNNNLYIQKWITWVGLGLFLLKLLAYWFTNSVAILTDTFESTINVLSGFIGWYSLYLASAPKDKNHPYGHGKVEFITATIEGVLILVAGLLIMYEIVQKLKNPEAITALDKGLILVLITALINMVMGLYAQKMGKKSHSLQLESTGKHLLSDSYSTFGIVAGLIILYFTHWLWLDALIGFVFGCLLIYTGAGIVRVAISGIMDEADEALLEKTIDHIASHKSENWVDLHNLRIIKYGTTLHFDCHLTVPYFITVAEAHQEVKKLETLVQNKFGQSVEMFVHTDGCEEFSCKICTKLNCAVRKFPHEKTNSWTYKNLTENAKHSL